MYNLAHNMVLLRKIMCMKCGVYDLVLPSVSVGVDETIGEEEEVGRQPISVISLQQLLEMSQF